MKDPKGYDNWTLDRLFQVLGYMENVLAVYNNIQQEIQYHVKSGALTDSEVAPLVVEINKAYQEIDAATILIEKAMDKKIRSLTGIRHLSQSAVRFKGQIAKLLDERRNRDKKPDLTIS